MTIKPLSESERNKILCLSTPTSAEELVKHLAEGGECTVTVIPHAGITFVNPVTVQRVHKKDDKWYFGVVLGEFQWIEFPSVGFNWTLHIWK